MLKPDSCIPCPLYNISDGYILSEGSGSNGVVILGEAGGYNEYIDNYPFRPHAQAGSKLEEVFKIVAAETGMPCSRSQFLIDNVCKCHPPGDNLAGASYEKGAIECCSKNFDNLMQVYKTNHNRTILALGNIPLKFLTGVSGIAEEKQSISHLRGYVFESKYGLVVPSLHPSFIRRGNNHLTPLLVEDIKRALGVAKGVYTSYQFHKDYKPPKYNTTPSLEDVESFARMVRENENKILTFDIETPKSGSLDEDEREELEDRDIISIQFSVERGTGIFFDLTGSMGERYTEVAKGILAARNVKANHNTWNFDNPRLAAKGLKVEGKVHDTMWMFKHYMPHLPRNLQTVVGLLGFPFPWKHLYTSNLNHYGCCDVDAVQWIVKLLPTLMKKMGVWGGYVNHIFRIHPILDRAREIGIPVNEEKRVALNKDFRQRRLVIHKELQEDIPLEVRDIHPKKKIGEDENGNKLYDYGYKTQDIFKIKVKPLGKEKDGTIRTESVGDIYTRYEGTRKKLNGEGKQVISFEEFLFRKYGLTLADFEELDEVTRQRTRISRYCIIKEFKASSNQLIRYLEWKQEEIKREIKKLVEERGDKSNPEITIKINRLKKLLENYEVPKDVNGKETTNKKELEPLYEKTNDPVLEKVVKIRSLDQNINNAIPNWKPSKDGRVHTTWGYGAPTGQFDARRPNILNASKHTEFGNEFRGIIEAPSGYTFVEFDYKSYHVATMGYCANDKDYIRFSQIDPHSILGSYIDPSIIGQSISLKWSDQDILLAAKEFKKRCKEIKAKDPLHAIDIRQELAKPTVLGNQLGLGPRKLQHQNRKFVHWVFKKERLAQRGVGISAEELQEILDNLFEKPRLFKQNIKDKAFIERKLIDEFGRIQYFYDIYTFSYSKKQGKWIKHEGDGAREPIAFRVQGTAFGALQTHLLEIENIGLCELHNFCNSIHDSVIFMPEIRRLDNCIADISSELIKPCHKLVNDATGIEGLKVGVEAAVGRNWMAYDKESNKEGMQEVKI